MTQEEKARRYDEALERAKRLYEQGTITESLSYVFPELSESEDERIRKAIIAHIKDMRYYDSYYGVAPDEMLAWLEKQEVKKIEEDDEEDCGIDGIWVAQSILEKTLGKVDGYQSDDGILEHKCAISAVKKLYEKKSTH